MMEGRVVICGGGTGGHINPGLAVARRLREMDVAVAWLGLSGGLEQRLVPAAGFDLRTVSCRAPGTGAVARISLMARLVPAARAARRILRELDARAVLGLGGYPSLPGMLAALGSRARRLIHEQNVLPGLANRLLAPFVHAILASSARTFSGARVRVTGNPVRAEFADQPEPADRLAADGPRRLLVLGGSQGARSLNQGVPQALGQLPDKEDWITEHAAGAGATAKVTAAYQEHGIDAEVADYFDDIAARMARAHLVICRAGASTVAELACLGTAAILVPYPHARGHQRANAIELEQAGAARIIDDAIALQRPQELAAVITAMGGAADLIAMAGRARALGKPDADRDVAAACMEQLKHV